MRVFEIIIIIICSGLHISKKGLTDEGKDELLTKADLISNYLILDVLQRFPKLKVDLKIRILKSKLNF